MAKIGELIRSGGTYGGVRIVSEKWVRESTSEHTRWAERDFPYGYLWWILEEEITEALGQKDIKLIISCGSDDDDCLPMAKDLYNAVRKAGLCANLFIHKNDRHRFPNEPSVSLDLL